MKILYLTVFSLPLLAFGLDLLLGDPRGLPHPVRLIGRWLDWLEPRARGWNMDLRRAGAICVAATALLCAAVVFGLMEIKLAGMLLAAYFAYAGLALGELLDSAKDVVEMLEEGEIEEAREAVAGLVTRSTAGMDEAALRKTLAETVSENFCDAFVAPLFYLVLGGPALMWAYKAVSTMDSMWGYRNERYKDFGWAAARADDLLAWLPARLSALLMIGAGALMRLDWRRAWDRVRVEAPTMESPNAGWPMSAAAWLLEGGMGGPAVYFGEVKDKPVLGPENAPWDLEKLKKLFRLVLLSGFAGVVLLQGIKALILA